MQCLPLTMASNHRASTGATLPRRHPYSSSSFSFPRQTPLDLATTTITTTRTSTSTTATHGLLSRQSTAASTAARSSNSMYTLAVATQSQAQAPAASKVAQWLVSSAFLQAVAMSRSDVLGDTRALTTAEVAALAKNGNSAAGSFSLAACLSFHKHAHTQLTVCCGTDAGFSNVVVLSGCNELSADAIKGCTFSGSVILGTPFPPNMQ